MDMYKSYLQYRSEQENQPNADLTEKLSLQKAWLKVLKQPDNAYFITLNFANEKSNKQRKDILKEFMKRLNQRTFKKDYKKRVRSLEGIIVREYNSANQVHYHIIIRDPHKDILRNGSFKKLVSKTVRSMQNDLKMKTVNVQPYYLNEDSEVNSLESYLVKCFDTITLDNCILNDSFSFLMSEGFTELSDPRDEY